MRGTHSASLSKAFNEAKLSGDSAGEPQRARDVRGTHSASLSEAFNEAKLSGDMRRRAPASS